MRHTSTALQTGWRRWLRHAVLIALLFFVLWLVQRVYFWATPAQPSPERVALTEQIEPYNVDSGSGLALLGFLAPAEMSPLAYGRCLAAASRATRQDADASHAANSGEDAHEQRTRLQTDRETACLQGMIRLMPVAQHASIRLNPQTTVKEWDELAATRVNPILVQRLFDTLDSPPRTLKVTSSNDLTLFADTHASLTAINTLQAATLRRAWRSSDRQAAESELQHLLVGWSSFAQDSLLAAMVATRTQTDLLLAIHSLTHSEPQDASKQDWAALIEITQSIDTMVNHVGGAVENEWLLGRFMVQGRQDQLARQAWHPSNVLFRTPFDADDSLNRYATMLLNASADVKQAASGQTPLAKPTERCAGFSLVARSDSLACSVLGRNGVGINLTQVAFPSHRSYGVRVADLRNLAAATRLTLEARRQGIAPGEASAQWVDSAAAHMRDVFTNQPYEYDPQRKVLRIPLRESNAALGEAGTEYELAI